MGESIPLNHGGHESTKSQKTRGVETTTHTHTHVRARTHTRLGTFPCLSVARHHPDLEVVEVDNAAEERHEELDAHHVLVRRELAQQHARLRVGSSRVRVQFHRRSAVNAARRPQRQQA